MFDIVFYFEKGYCASLVSIKKPEPGNRVSQWAKRRMASPMMKLHSGLSIYGHFRPARDESKKQRREEIFA